VCWVSQFRPPVARQPPLRIYRYPPTQVSARCMFDRGANSCAGHLFHMSVVRCVATGDPSSSKMHIQLPSCSLSTPPTSKARVRQSACSRIVQHQLPRWGIGRSQVVCSRLPENFENLRGEIYDRDRGHRRTICCPFRIRGRGLRAVRGSNCVVADHRRSLVIAALVLFSLSGHRPRCVWPSTSAVYSLTVARQHANIVLRRIRAVDGTSVNTLRQTIYFAVDKNT
jgi:hypothetical protein